MKITILTEDSKVQLPDYHKWRRSFKGGIEVTKHPDLISYLKNNNITIPTDDFQNEQHYQTILKEFLRPAKYMFAGNFSEVRSFEEEIKRKFPYELLILSGRYGLINGNSKIVPYNCIIETEKQLKKIDEKFHLLKKLKDSVKESTHLIIILPKFFISYFLMNGWFDSLDQNLNLVLVSSMEFERCFSNQHNVIILQRRGVARIGKQNVTKIFIILDDSQGKEKKI
jgi:hypothetical protein